MKHALLFAANIEDKLSLVALVLVDSHFADIEVTEDILKRCDSRIGNVVEHLIGDNQFVAIGTSCFLLFGRLLDYSLLGTSSANRAASQHRKVGLRPMTPYERRIIHIALRDDDQGLQLPRERLYA